MDDTFWIVVLVVCAVAAVALYAWGRRGRRQVDEGTLRRRFGPEYERALDERGSTRSAQRALAKRMRRVEKLDIRPLGEEAQTRFENAWRRVQARFVDEPLEAVIAAHDLVEDVMRARGYPVDSFEQEVEDLSVHHAGVVQHYRAARVLARGAEEGTASTEDLRQAMVHYRALFADLLERDVRAREEEEAYA